MVQPCLTGRTVLELGSFLAAPFAANILLELGADVIKVEPLAGDPTRSMGKTGDPSGTFAAYSRGKKSVSLDLRSDEGHAIFDRLLTNADIIIHNLSPESSRRLKVTHDDCYRVNPRIVYCHIRGYGPGPLENDLASNPAIEAATGVMYGHRINGRPTRFGPSYHDQFAGAYSVIGILAALSSNADDKESRCVEVGLYESGLHVAARDLVNRQLKSLSGIVEPEPEAGEFSFAGYGAYETADGHWIFLVMMTDLHWTKFCEVMAPEANVPDLGTSRQRKEQRPRVEALVSNAVRGLAYDIVAARLRSVNFGFTEVKLPAEVLNDPQALVPGKIAYVPWQNHVLKVPAFPIASPLVRRNVETPAPQLGQHNLEVLQSLGYDAAACEALQKKGILGGVGKADKKR